MNTNKKIMKSVINKTPNIERISQLLIAVVLYAFTLVLVFPSYMQKITIPPIGETVEESLILKRTIKYKNREETDKLINYSKANIRPIFDMPAEIKENTISNDKEEYDDPLYNDIVEFVIENQKASASLLQRRFKLGYNRAARIIDLLEERGIIGPQNGSKPREVLVKLEDSKED